MPDHRPGERALLPSEVLKRMLEELGAGKHPFTAHLIGRHITALEAERGEWVAHAVVLEREVEDLEARLQAAEKLAEAVEALLTGLDRETQAWRPTPAFVQEYRDADAALADYRASGDTPDR